MRAVIERSGGFANIRQVHSVSTDQIPEEEAQKLRDLVEASGFYKLPPVISSTEPGADRFQYRVTVESEHGSHTVQVDEAAVPPCLQPLLDWLKSSARPRTDK